MASGMVYSCASRVFLHLATPYHFYCHSSPLLGIKISHPSFLISGHSQNFRTVTSYSPSDDRTGITSISGNDFLNDELIGRVTFAKGADEALAIIAEMSGSSHGVVSVPACCSVIRAAIERGNYDLALSVFFSMRSSFDQSLSGNGPVTSRWKWPKADVRIYGCLVVGLAVHLKVSDALRVIGYICRVGVSPAEEVPFGKVVKCPSCVIAVAVSQPQQGIQIVSCAQCCYQYELVSGDITSINSEEIRMDLPAWKRGLRFLQIMKETIPAAIHSIVVQTPSGMARTHKFATKTVDLPAQEGERVTIASAAPSTVYRNLGPLRLNPKASNLYPGEPMCLTNHKDGRQTPLLRAPSKDEGLSLLNPSVLVPLIAVLATGDAASSFIDPSLPQLLSIAAIAAVGVGATLNTLVLPQLSKIPSKSVEVIAIKQELLSQYDVLQLRIKNLKEATEKEIWMLARMCQLENKIFAVGEPSYSARKVRVKKVREGLEKSVKSRIELIDSYARISSIIEIEVEMDSDVLAAEAVTNVESIAEQIQQVMELEDLEESWRIQAEANDEAERLLSQQSMPTEIV